LEVVQSCLAIYLLVSLVGHHDGCMLGRVGVITVILHSIVITVTGEMDGVREREYIQMGIMHTMELINQERWTE